MISETDARQSPMSEPQMDALLAHGRALFDYIPPCPWNPFPRDSPWGRKIEFAYRLDQHHKRRRLALKESSNADQ